MKNISDYNEIIDALDKIEDLNKNYKRRFAIFYSTLIGTYSALSLTGVLSSYQFDKILSVLLFSDLYGYSAILYRDDVRKENLLRELRKVSAILKENNIDVSEKSLLNSTFNKNKKERSIYFNDKAGNKTCIKENLTSLKKELLLLDNKDLEKVKIKEKKRR